tara:strand:- start:18 stop:2294 length:2277 start_codon:yes stop_codon:yes gene_type:complete
MGNEYVRNDTANNIADGNVISAADLDGEFDKLLGAFNASAGHTHDGTTGEGGPITKLLGTAITIGDGTAGTDIAVTFDGETSDGTLTWMEDESRFDFANKVKVVDSTDVDVADTTVGALVVNGGIVSSKDLLVGDDIFLDSNSSEIQFGASQDIKLKHTADTSITLEGEGSTTGLIINNTATDGDPFLAFALSGTAKFTMGVEDGDSDKFKIGTTAIATGTILTLTNDDVILSDDLSMQSDGAVINFGQHDDVNLIHSADVGLILENDEKSTTGFIINNDADDGDPFLSFALSGTQTFTMGVDDGDGDKFKIGTTAIGTNTRLSIDSSGNTEVTGVLTVANDFVAKTSDGAIVKIQTSDTSVEDGNTIGAIEFSAPDEAGGTDAITTAASIVAEADATFASDNNQTDLVFKLGSSEAATEKFRMTHEGDLSVSNDLSLTTDSSVINMGADSDVTLTHDGTTGVTFAGNPITLDSGGDITLDAEGANIIFKDGGTTIAKFINSSSDFVIATDVDDKDFIIKGQDSTSEITALTLDMSEAGNASFNGTVTANAGVIVDNITIDGTEIDLSAGDLTVDVAGDIILDAGGNDFKFQASGTEVLRITNNSSDVEIKPTVDTKDIIFKQYDGTAVMTIEDDVSVTINNDVNVVGRATGTVTTNTNGEMDLSLSNHFNYTPSGTDEIVLSNFKAGQSGTIFLDNSGGHTLSVDGPILINADQLTAIKTAGKYMLSYFCTVDQPNADITNAANDDKIIMSVSGALT